MSRFIVVIKTTYAMNALMIADEIRELQHASPFEPYTIHTSDGKALYVHHPVTSSSRPEITPSMSLQTKRRGRS